MSGGSVENSFKGYQHVYITIVYTINKYAFKYYFCQ
jgi:hypothetical protein